MPEIPASRNQLIEQPGSSEKSTDELEIYWGNIGHLSSISVTYLDTLGLTQIGDGQAGLSGDRNKLSFVFETYIGG